VDANWNKMNKETIQDLVQYGAEKNVGIILWYNSGGSHNSVPEEPRDRMFDRNIRRQEFAYLNGIGIKGIKVDFFHSDKQAMIGLYQDILEDAADFGLLVNFHGCTLPRGWARTYPNLMSMEGVRGAESYKFDLRFPDAAPSHNTILPFTRNVVGSMDYTPVTFSDNTYPHKTTNGHELALSVIFESGWMHFADKVESYLNLPEAPKRFLQNVPTTWDDTHWLAGEPGKLAVIARKKADTWFIGGINGHKDSVKSEIHLGFLDSAPYTLWVINDDNRGKGFCDWTAKITAADSLTLSLKPYGGFVATLVPIE
jgi:alpha-glucosidase